MRQRFDTRAWASLLQPIESDVRSKHERVIELFVEWIETGRIPVGARLPATRALATQLAIGRNTALRALTSLSDRGYIELRERSGTFVADRSGGRPTEPTPSGSSANWAEKFEFGSLADDVSKPLPSSTTTPVSFKFGGFDISLFPTTQWRECERAALGVLEIADWARDRSDGDDSVLVSQIRRHVLPQHGIWARDDEILITLGGQESRYLVGQMLGCAGITVGLENPCVPDTAKIFARTPANVVSLEIDGSGAVLDAKLRYDALLLTPGHQYPTTAVMPAERQRQILERAEVENFFVVEDTFETEIMVRGQDSSPMKSLDRQGRVIYIGTLSRLMAPGLRAGFIVAPPIVIRQLRALQRLILRHPPGNNQRLLAIFIERGYYNAFLRSASDEMERRSVILAQLLRTQMPEIKIHHQRGTSTMWCDLPQGIDSDALERSAAAAGVLLESGSRFFRDRVSHGHIRLSVSSTDDKHIREGASRIAEALQAM